MNKAVKTALVIGSLVMFAGCGGGGGGGGDPPPPPPTPSTLVGVVSAPGGTLAFSAPSWGQRMFAWIVGDTATAAISGTAPVANATVNLIEINIAGAQVGSVIASTTTNASGAFSLQVPANFTPGSQYVVRALGTTSNMDAIVTATTGINVDPSTEATKQLLLTVLAANPGASFANVTTSEVRDIQARVDEIVNQIGPAVTAAAMTTAIVNEAQGDPETANVIASVLASGVIQGRVTNAAGAGLADIVVSAGDFKDWLVRAETRTDADGNYTLNVPVSSEGYIVAALNYTNDASMAASEWYSASGGAVIPWNADRVVVSSGTPTTVNFQLDSGARLTGTITSDGTTGIAGAKVQIRDFDSSMPVGQVTTGTDGRFTINVRPATRFTVGVQNEAAQLPYASGWYNGPVAGGSATNSGAAIQNAGTGIATVAGSSYSANMQLAAGYLISGQVTDGATTPAPISGLAVRFHDENSNFMQGARTGIDGRYRMWMRPDTYLIRTRGQAATRTVSYGPLTVSFNAVVYKARLVALTGPTTPVSQVRVRVYDAAASFPSGETGYQGFEVTLGDGSVEVYSTVANNRLALDPDLAAPIGASVYNGLLSLGAATGTHIVTFSNATATDVGTITLPPGINVSGTVTVGGQPAATGTYIVQVRHGGTNLVNTFVQTRVQSDGSYRLNLPAGTFSVRACLSGSCSGAFRTVTVSGTPLMVTGDTNFAL